MYVLTRGTLHVSVHLVLGQKFLQGVPCYYHVQINIDIAGITDREGAHVLHIWVAYCQTKVV